MTPKSVLLSFIALNSLVGASSPGGDTSANAVPAEDSCAASGANLPCRADQMGVAEQLMRRMAAEMEASEDASVRLKARTAKALAEMCRAGKPELRYLPLLEMTIDYLSLPGHRLAAAEVLPLLLEAGVNPNGAEDDGAPLFAAVEQGNLEAFRILRAAGARTDVQNDSERMLPVEMAVHHAAEMLAELPDAGLKSMRLKGGYTLLHAAMRDPDPEDCCCGRELPKVEAMLATCRFLIEKGVDVNAAADDGETALMRVMYGFDDVARLLLEAGADANARDKEGNTALDRAVQSGDVQRCRLLWAAGGKLANGSLTHLAVLLGDVAELRRLLPGRSAEELAQLLDVALMNRQWDVCRLLVGRMGQLAYTDEWRHTLRYLTDYREEGAMPEDIRASMMALLSLPDRLRYAVCSGDEALCRECLNAGAEPDGSLLFIAAIEDKPAIIRALAEAGAEVNCTGEGGWTPLYWAAQRGHLECVRELLRAGANPNGAEAPEAKRHYPLLIALQYCDSTDCVRALLDAGAGPDLNSPRVLMLLGARCTDPDTLRLLSDRGLSLRGNRRVLQEHVAARPDYGYARAEYCDVLLEAGAQLDDWSLLHLEVRLNRPEKVRALIAAGADVNARDAEGNTPLMCAALLGNEEMIRILLEAGAQTDSTNKEGDISPQVPVAEVDECDPSRVRDASHLLELLALKDKHGLQAAVALYRAVKEADVLLLHRLLSAGVSPNLCVGDGNTPLHTAATLPYYFSRPLTLRLLLAYGADPQAKNAEGLTPSQLAEKEESMRSSSRRVFEALADPAGEEAAPQRSTVPESVESLIAELPKPVLRTGAYDDHYAPDKIDYRRLHFLMQLWREGALPLRELPLMESVAEYTAEVGRPEAGVEPVRALLAAGAPVDGADGNGEPLVTAVKAGNAPVCRVLLEAGARTDLVDARGRSLLYSAAVHHHAECVRLLLEKGCRPEFLSDFNTLLHAAIEDPEPEDCMCGTAGPPEDAMVDICRALLAAGADVNAKDRDGATPLLLAVGLDWERPQLVKLLLDAGADMSADKRGYTPLDIAVYCMDEEVSRMLEAAGCVQSKTSPLQLAILLNRPDDVKKLLAAGADTGKSVIRGNEKITPLKYARLLGREEIARLLSEHSTPEEQPHPAEMKRPQVGGSLLGALVGGGKVQVHALQPQYDGDLWRALSDGDIAECDRLLKAGAKLQPENPNIIDAAMRSAESVRWLMAHGATVEMLRDTMRMLGRSACNFSRATDKERFRKQVRVLLDAGIPLPEGWNLLHLSAAVGDVELVRRMIAGGVDINARNDEGNTALLLAVMNDDSESVRLLLEAGAEADAPDAEGVTPLECSVVRYTDPHISRSLLAAGADARRRMRSGDTLLHAALASPERVYDLLRAGADVFARDAKGRTPRERAMAEGSGNELTVRLLAAFESAARGDAKREPQTPSAETTGTVARLLESALGDAAAQPEWRVRELTEMREHLCRLQAGEEQANHYPWVIQLMTTFPSAPGWTIHRQTPFGPFTRVLRDVPTVAEDELLAALTEMVQCGASVRRTDSDGNTALYLAAQNGRESLCRRLIELGADVNRRNSRRETALHAAAQWGHAACVSALLECGADVELNDGDDCELLKAALTPVPGKNGYLTKPSVEVVRLLLEAGASMNDDELPIRAGRYGNDELVRLLARYGVDVLLCDSGDKQVPQTPGAETTGTVARLLESALGDAAAQPEWRVRELTEMREHLSRLQAGEEQVNAYPWVLRILTVFPTATEQELLAAQAEMIQCGAAVNGTDSYGNTALYFAASRSGDAVCRRLIELGAEVNSLNEWKQSALHAAAQRGHAACVAALLEAGAQPELCDAHGRTPLMAALTPMLSKKGPLNKPSVEVVRLLLDAGAPVKDAELLIRAGQYGDAELVRLLARHGADVAWRNRFGKTALDYARPELKAVLANAPDAAGMTPLLRAAEKGDVEMCRKLIAAGADPEAKDEWGCTPLALAQHMGLPDVVMALREAEASVIVADHEPKDGVEEHKTLYVYTMDNGVLSTIRESVCGCSSSYSILYTYAADGRLVSARVHTETATDDSRREYAIEDREMTPHERLTHKMFAEPRVLRARAEEARQTVMQAVQAKACMTLLRDGKLPKGALYNISFDEAAAAACEIAGHYAAVRAGQESIARYPYIAELLLLCEAQERRLPVAVLEALLAAGADVNARAEGGSGELPLDIALRMGDAPAVQRLKAAGARKTPSDCPDDEDDDTELPLPPISERCWYPLNRESMNRHFPLHAAVALGSRSECEQLLADGADVNGCNEEGRTPLHEAANVGHAQLCSLLLRQGADPFALDTQGNTPLDEAAHQGNAACCRVLYAAMQRAVAPSREGLLYCRNLRTLRALLQMGMPPNATDECGHTQLHFEAFTGRANRCRVLMAAGADVNARSKQGETPLMRAVQPADGAEDVEGTVSALLARGADVHAKDENGRTALHLAAREGRVSLCAALLMAGAEVNAPDAAGKTPLHMAVHDEAECVQLLLDVGAQVNARDEQGLTPLHELFSDDSRGKSEVCRALLAAGADVHAANAGNRTPLVEAAASGKAECCELLLAAGASVNVRDTEGRTIFSNLRGKYLNYNEVVDLLVQAGADVNADDDVLWTAALNNMPEVYDRLAAAGARLTCGTPLHAAAALGRVDECRRLIEAGADVNARVGLSAQPRSLQLLQAATPLHLAARAGHGRACRALLDAGADVNARDAWQRTPLHLTGSPGVAALLLDSGADPEAADARGDRPLKSAAAAGREPVCWRLLQRGASLDAPGYGGYTARDVAELLGCDAVVKLISQYIRGTVELKATQAFIPFSYLPGMPQPSETRPEFSRPPCDPVALPGGGVLLERVELPSADSSCAVFYHEEYELSADGMKLYVRCYSLVAPQRLAYGAMKGNVESSFRVYETVTPRTFVVEGRVLRFEQNPDGSIRSLRMARVDAPEKDPVHVQIR